MKKIYSRRDVLRLGLGAGVALSPLGLYGCGGGGGAPAVDGVPPPVIPPPADGYKALVAVLLLGGNDAYNLMVPTTAEKYATYAAARGNLAIGRSSLLPLNGLAGDGASYGLHPRCTELADLFNSGRAAIAANVGSLVGPTTHADFLAQRNLPPRLFSHNDQRDQWASANVLGSGGDGWGGRIADVMPGANPGALLPINLSIAGANLYQAGQVTNALAVASSGPQSLANLGATQPLRLAYQALQGLPHDHLFEREYASSNRRAVDMHAQLRAALDATPAPATAFPANNDLADQLSMVARIIGARGRLGLRRQIFYVALANFDTHDAQATRQAQLLTKLSQALAAFDGAMNELGVGDRVTTFTTSDFGRSLSVNSDGTDHGWSGHHFALGGAVRGGQIYGTPPSLVLQGSDDTRGGRFIPSTSIDEYAATFARWFGVSDGDLAYVLPNLPRFATRGLPLFG